MKNKLITEIKVGRKFTKKILFLSKIWIVERGDSNEEKPVLVDFYADWCGPCNAMSPVIEELAKELEGKAKVGKINVDENSDIAVEYNVMSIPTLIVFKNGKEEKRLVGLRDKEELLSLF